MINLSHKQPSVVVFSADYEFNACAIIRLLDPLIATNWQVVWITEHYLQNNHFDFEVARRADLIIIQRHFPSASTAKILRKVLSFKVPVAYDLDDMFLDIPVSHPHYNGLKRRQPFVKWILNEADLVTVSTAPIQEAFRKHTSRPIHVNPNLVDWELFEAEPRSRDGRFNILISGSPTHRKDWEIIEEPLLEILNVYSGDVQAVFFGELPEKFVNNKSAQFIGFERKYRDYASSLRQLDVHAALVPLEDTWFNLCKSNIKWLEYAAAGIPGAYSDLTPYNSCIENEKNGILVKATTDSWYQALEYLINNTDSVGSMIARARQEVYDRFSVQNAANGYVEAFRGLIGTKHHQGFADDVSMLSHRLRVKFYEPIYSSRFMYRHILWRFDK